MRSATLVVTVVIVLASNTALGKKGGRPRKGARSHATTLVTRASDKAAVAQLARARVAFEGGDYGLAYSLAAPLAGARLVNHDYAVYLAAQAAYLQGDRARALPLFRKLTGMTGSRFQPAATYRVADCLWDMGKRAEAAKRYERVLSVDAGPSVDQGAIIFRLGHARAHSGHQGSAVAMFRRLALGFPEHPLADRAVEWLATLGEGPLSPRERLARAERFTLNRAWNRALEELSQIGDNPSEEVRVLRDFWTGETLFKMRRQYARAGELLLGVYESMGSRAAQALFHGARALSRADRDDEAIRGYQLLVSKYPGSTYSSEAQFLSGWLEYNRGNYRAALPRLQKLLERFPSSRWVDDALWYLGFSHFLLGEHAQALPYLEKLSEKGGDLVGGKGRYWRARALDMIGRKDGATGILRDLVGRYPFSWYSLLARSRLKERGIALGPFGDRSVSVDQVPRFGAIDNSLAKDIVIARADELLSARMNTEAGQELLRGEMEFLSRHGSARGLPILLDRYRRAGSFHRPWMLSVSRGGKALLQRPQGEARLWWEHAYPLAYRELVERHQVLGNNPPYYLYAIMRKESGFNPHDVSYADAIGLLQMIPPTTRRVAPQVGLEYTDDLLYEPELNIKVGSWYIGRLTKKFKIQIPIAAGSYNSGPKPVMKWLDRFGDRPMDELVELVSYTQTREYMKKVTDGFARYLYLYEGTEYEQPLTVDRAYVRDDLDY
ncbi:MAG: transglycosylase SLT domain-containing protein [Deltaproteobacteria bacterium]|nr:transglycosylase SLT domain-containing protein [Deltaproteobacteria bacterium]